MTMLMSELTCEECGQTFKNEQGLGIHRSAKHGEAGPFYCDCGSAFATQYGLHLHQVRWCRLVDRPGVTPAPTVDPRKEPTYYADGFEPIKDRLDPLACPWRNCDHVAPDVAARNQHVLHDCWHRPDRPEEPVCPGCGDTFPSLSGMKQHRRTCELAQLA